MRGAVALDTLAREGFGAVHGDAGVHVAGVRHDSRAVEPGDLFAAVPGATVDGARFAGEAVARGAAAVLAESPMAGLPVPTLVVPSVRRALGPVAERVYGRPTSGLAVAGVTGTNGKTTVTWLLDAALRALGARPALLGTVVARDPDGRAVEATLTTPEGDDVARFARHALDLAGTHLLMEVSSIALALHRPDGVAFDVVACTNLTRDHLDFHGTLEAYAAAKRRLFSDVAPGAARVVHADDPFAASLAALPGGGPRLRCSARGAPDAEVRAVAARAGREGVSARVATPAGEVAIESALVGAHNLENLLVALGILLAFGHEAPAAAAALGAAPAAPGRLERVGDPRGEVAVFVDYAHTPDALGRALDALRPITPGRLLVVFGCGGDRDAGKRAPMGEAAAARADLAVLTSDNPRTEDPLAILAPVEEGARAAGRSPVREAGLATAAGGYVVVPDRAEAIALAVAAARPGDTVLVAGKGHEPYQIVGRDRRPFDDRDEAARALEARPGQEGRR